MATQLRKVTVAAINELLTDITNFSQALYSNKDYPNKEKDYESIKTRVHEMSSIISSYRGPVANKPELVTDINDPRYNPIEVFNESILPVYKSSMVFESINDPDDKVFERMRESIKDHTLKASDVTLEIYPKWKKRITIYYDCYHHDSDNGEIRTPLGGLNGNLQVLLFEKYLSRIFPDGNIYVCTKEEYRSGYPIKAVYLAFKDSSVIDLDDYDEEEEYPSPFFRFKKDTTVRLADAAYAIMKNTTVYSIRNRYSILSW